MDAPMTAVHSRMRYPSRHCIVQSVIGRVVVADALDKHAFVMTGLGLLARRWAWQL